MRCASRLESQRHGWRGQQRMAKGVVDGHAQIEIKGRRTSASSPDGSRLPTRGRPSNRIRSGASSAICATCVHSGPRRNATAHAYLRRHDSFTRLRTARRRQVLVSGAPGTPRFFHAPAAGGLKEQLRVSPISLQSTFPVLTRMLPRAHEPPPLPHRHGPRPRSSGTHLGCGLLLAHLAHDLATSLMTRDHTSTWEQKAAFTRARSERESLITDGSNEPRPAARGMCSRPFSL